MKSYTLQPQTSSPYQNIVDAWKAGNHVLIDQMGDDYAFLDNDGICTAMAINEDVVDAIKSSLSKSMNKSDRAVASIAKSVARGDYFKEVGIPLPKSVVPGRQPRISEVIRGHDNSVDKQAKAIQTGRNNPVFQRLMPGDLNGEFVGKTGKFSIEYQTGDNVAKILNQKSADIADYADEILGNDIYTGNKKRIFVSDELRLANNKSVCVVMYHGIDGDQNKEIANAVRESVRDSMPFSVGMRMSNNYSVLDTELKNAMKTYGSDIKSDHTYKDMTPATKQVLDESLVSDHPSYDTQMSL